jgi:hypothetical protein
MAHYQEENKNTYSSDCDGDENNNNHSSNTIMSTCDAEADRQLSAALVRSLAGALRLLWGLLCVTAARSCSNRDEGGGQAGSSDAQDAASTSTHGCGSTHVGTMPGERQQLQQLQELVAGALGARLNESLSSVVPTPAGPDQWARLSLPPPPPTETESRQPGPSCGALSHASNGKGALSAVDFGGGGGGGAEDMWSEGTTTCLQKEVVVVANVLSEALLLAIGLENSLLAIKQVPWLL